MKFTDLGDKGAQLNITVEAAPAGVKLAAGAAMGALSGVGGHILGAVFGPIGSIGMAAAMAHQGATLGMKMADKIWDFFSDKLGGDDNAEEFAMAHLTAAVKGLPTFDYRGKTYNVKVPQQQARAAAVEVRKVTESLTERRQGGLNEFAPSGDDDGGEDPYKHPKPRHYSRSIDFFGQFEADHFDREDMNDATGEFKGYWDYDGKLKQIAYFKFDKPNQAGSDDPGMGWYYEPNEDGGAGASATPAVDNSAQRKQQELGMIDAFLKSGQKAKPGSQIYALMKKHGMAEGVVGHDLDEASLAQMRDYFNQADTDSVQVDRNYDAPSKKQNPAGIPHEIQALVNKMYHAGKISPQEFEVLRKFQQRTKINVGIREADTNPYAIGMSHAMKSTGDTPPLKKSTINKAHKIARAIKKDE